MSTSRISDVISLNGHQNLWLQLSFHMTTVFKMSRFIVISSFWVPFLCGGGGHVGVVDERDDVVHWAA